MSLKHWAKRVTWLAMLAIVVLAGSIVGVAIAGRSSGAEQREVALRRIAPLLHGHEALVRSGLVGSSLRARLASADKVADKVYAAVAKVAAAAGQPEGVHDRVLGAVVVRMSSKPETVGSLLGEQRLELLTPDLAAFNGLHPGKGGTFDGYEFTLLDLVAEPVAVVEAGSTNAVADHPGPGSGEERVVLRARFDVEPERVGSIRARLDAFCQQRQNLTCQFQEEHTLVLSGEVRAKVEDVDCPEAAWQAVLAEAAGASGLRVLKPADAGPFCTCAIDQVASLLVREDAQPRAVDAAFQSDGGANAAPVPVRWLLPLALVPALLVAIAAAIVARIASRYRDSGLPYSFRAPRPFPAAIAGLVAGLVAATCWWMGELGLSRAYVGAFAAAGVALTVANAWTSRWAVRALSRIP